MCKTWILQSYEDATPLNLRGKKSPMNLLRDTLLQSLSREKKINLSTTACIPGHCQGESGNQRKKKDTLLQNYLKEEIFK